MAPQLLHGAGFLISVRSPALAGDGGTSLLGREEPDQLLHPRKWGQQAHLVGEDPPRFLCSHHETSEQGSPEWGLWGRPGSHGV